MGWLSPVAQLPARKGCAEQSSLVQGLSPRESRWISPLPSFYTFISPDTPAPFQQREAARKLHRSPGVSGCKCIHPFVLRSAGGAHHLSSLILVVDFLGAKHLQLQLTTISETCLGSLEGKAAFSICARAPRRTNFFLPGVLAQHTLVPFLKGGEKKKGTEKLCEKIKEMKKTSSKKSVSQDMWMPQWCTSTVVYLWFLFTTHSGISSPEPQSQVERQESSPASLHFWILEDSLLWWLESRVWQYHLQTPGFLKVWMQKRRHFIWHFEQTDVYNLSNEPCIRLCFKRKKDLTIHFCELYSWGDLGWCGKYLCTANTIYYCDKSWVLAKYNGLVKSFLWGADAWILPSSLVAYSLSERH